MFFSVQLGMLPYFLFLPGSLYQSTDRRVGLISTQMRFREDRVCLANLRLGVGARLAIKEALETPQVESRLQSHASLAHLSLVPL